MGIQIEMAVTDGIEMQYFRFGEGKRKMVMLPGLSVKSIMIYKDAIADGCSQFANCIIREAGHAGEYRISDLYRMS